MSCPAEPLPYKKYKNEPGLVYSPREKQGGAYLTHIKTAGTPAELTFEYFGALVELPWILKEQVGDITFENHCIVREVKTKEDLGTSMMEGRLFNQMIYMWYLKLAGIVKTFGFIIRDISKQLNQAAQDRFLSAMQALEDWQDLYGFNVACVDSPAEVVAVAKTAMRRALWPNEPKLPTMLIKEGAFEYSPLAMQLAASCHGFAEIRSSQLAEDYAPAEFWSEVLADDVNSEDEFQSFYDKFSNKYGIKEKLLREVWKVGNRRSARPQPPESYFILQT